MKKTEYLKPIVRVKPLVIEGALMDFSIDPDTEVTDGHAKEFGQETDDFDDPTDTNLWWDQEDFFQSKSNL